MKVFLSSLSLLFVLFSEGGRADTSAQEICPLGLKQLIDGGSSSCEETYPIARPFLNEASDERLAQSNRFLGDLLLSSIKADLKAMAHIDQIYMGLGLEIAPVESCSLERVKTELPCEVSSSNLASLTKHLPGGGVNKIDDLMGMISKEYKDLTLKSRDSQGNSCLNGAWSVGISIESMINLDVDFNTFMEFEWDQEGSLSDQQKNEFARLHEELGNFFPSFYTVMKEIKPSEIAGSSLKDQLTNFLQDRAVIDKFQQSIGDTCSKMIETIGGVVCSLPDNGPIESRDFNLGALNYNPEDFQDGFDEFALELSGASDPQLAYANYILNCAPTCEGCEINKVSMDEILNEKFDKSVEEIIFLGGVEAAQFQGVKENESFCPLLNCENALEVFKGESCTKRQSWRTPAEIDTLLNCPEDEMCKEDSFKSFTRILASQASSNGPKAASANPSRLSSFSRQFLGESFEEEAILVTEEGQDTPEPQAKPRIEAPESDFAQARQRVDRADARLQDRNQSRVGARRGSQSNRSQPFGARARARSARVASNRDTYKDVGGESEDSSYDDVLKSLIDVVRGQNDVDRLRDELVDGSLQDIARNNQEAFSRFNQEQTNIGAAVPTGRGYARPQNRAQVGIPDRGLAPLEVELPGQENAFEDQVVGNTVSPTGPKGAAVAAGSASSRAGLAGNGSGRAAADTASSLNTDSADAEEASLPQYEINQRTLRGMNAAALRSSLRRKGIKPDRPFIMLVKDDRGQIVKLPVKPVAYLGQSVFVPIIMRANSKILDLVEQSPLFRGYRDYMSGR